MTETTILVLVWYRNSYWPIISANTITDTKTILLFLSKIVRYGLVTGLVTGLVKVYFHVRKINILQFRFLLKKLRQRYQYRNSLSVSVSDTDTKFWSDTNIGNYNWIFLTKASFNRIPTSQRGNQPLYERNVTPIFVHHSKQKWVELCRKTKWKVWMSCFKP